MSNQVYANSQLKFFPCPGIKSWAVAETVIAHAPSNGVPTTAIVPFDLAVVQQGPSDQVSVSAGVVSFHETGIYSITAKLSFEHATVPNDSYSDARFYVELSGGFAANTAKLADIQQKWMDADQAPATDGTLNRITTLNYVGYFAAGDAISVKASNFRTGSGNGLKILSPDSGLFISKLI